MKLNLGCGSDKRKGYVNVDKMKKAKPDQVVDLESLPWPWPDSSVDEIVMKHVLEHLGADTETYLGIIAELYRIAKPKAKIVITVPHPRHDHYLNDPTHVRPITIEGLEMFSQAANRRWQKQKVANTPLGQFIGVDFEIADVQMLPDEPWRGRFQRGEINQADLHQAMRMYNNVIMETTITWRAVKPAGKK